MYVAGALRKISCVVTDHSRPRRTKRIAGNNQERADNRQNNRRIQTDLYLRAATFKSFGRQDRIIAVQTLYLPQFLANNDNSPHYQERLSSYWPPLPEHPQEPCAIFQDKWPGGVIRALSSIILMCRSTQDPPSNALAGKFPDTRSGMPDATSQHANCLFGQAVKAKPFPSLLLVSRVLRNHATERQYCSLAPRTRNGSTLGKRSRFILLHMTPSVQSELPAWAR